MKPLLSIVAILSALLLQGQTPHPAKTAPLPTVGMSDDDVERAVLVILKHRYGMAECDENLINCDKETIRDGRHQISCVRLWLKTQHDPRLIEHYERWLEYYARDYAAAQQALENKRKGEEGYLDRIMRQQRKAVSDANKLPTPGDCKP